MDIHFEICSEIYGYQLTLNSEELLLRRPTSVDFLSGLKEMQWCREKN